MSKIMQVKVARWPGGVNRLQVLVRADSGKYCTIWSEFVQANQVESTIRDIQAKLDMLVEASPGMSSTDLKPS